MIHVESHLVLVVSWWKLVEKADANLVKNDKGVVDTLRRGPCKVPKPPVQVDRWIAKTGHIHHVPTRRVYDVKGCGIQCGHLRLYL